MKGGGKVLRARSHVSSEFDPKPLQSLVEWVIPSGLVNYSPGYFYPGQARFRGRMSGRRLVGTLGIWVFPPPALGAWALARRPSYKGKLYSSLKIDNRYGPYTFSKCKYI